MAEVSPRAQLLAELAGEVLAILLGVWMIVGLGWDEFGPVLVVVGAIGLVATIVRAWTGRGRATSEAAPDQRDPPTA